MIDRPWNVLLGAAMSLVLLVPGLRVVAHDRMLPIHELAGDAHSIFVGTVTSVKVFERDGVPRTRVTLQVVGSLDQARKPGRNPRLVAFEQLGGDLGHARLHHDHQPIWEMGESYLVFRADPEAGGMHEVHGGEAGYYRLIRDVHDQEIYPVDAHGRGIMGIKAGRFDLSRPVRMVRDGIATLTPAEPFFDAPVSSDGRVGTVATFEDEVEILDLDEVLEIVRDTLGMADRPMPRPESVGFPTGGTNLQRGLGLCWCGFHDIFLRYQQIHPSWACYDNNEWSMAEFNYYLDLHRYIATDGTWGAPNGTDELAGFTTSSTLNSVYGPGSGWGPSTLAVNWTWTVGDCTEILEADIHMNPAYTWRYTFEDAFQGSSTEYFYDPIMMHEIGHSLGLERNTCNEDYLFDRNTIMSAGSNDFVETGRGLHRRDAWVLRQVYDENQGQATTIQRTDMGVESWYMDGNIENGSIIPSTVQQGDTITMRDLVVENISTWDVSNVRVRCFFSTNMTISEHDHQSDTSYYEWATFDYDTDTRVDLDWKVPNDLPPGDYYVGVIVTYNGSNYRSDGVWGNNATFFPDKITVTQGDPPVWQIVPIPLDWFLNTQFFVNTGNAADGPAPPNCPGAGPDKAFVFEAPASGKFELAPSEFMESETFEGQRIITSACDNNNEILASNCDTTANNPLVFEVQPGREYRLRIYTTDGQPVRGWFTGRLVPEIEFGSAPQLPIEWTQGQDQVLGQEFGGPYDLPCFNQTDFGRWYVYEPPIDGRMVASTCDGGTDFPSVVSIHRFEPGTPVIGCGSFQDGTCPEDLGARATAEVERGKPVLVRVASVDGLGGFSLDIVMDQAEGQDVKCDTAPRIDEPGVYLVSGVNSMPSDILNCEGEVTPRRGTWLEVFVASRSELVVTPCEDLGGDSTSRMSVFIFGGECDDPTPIACDNFACTEGGAFAEVEPGTYRVFFQTDDAAEIVVEMNDPDCFADVNDDGIVNAADLGLLLGEWGPCNDCPGDLDGNGRIDAADLGLLLAAFGECP